MSCYYKHCCNEFLLMLLKIVDSGFQSVELWNGSLVQFSQDPVSGFCSQKKVHNCVQDQHVVQTQGSHLTWLLLLTATVRGEEFTLASGIRWQFLFTGRKLTPSSWSFTISPQELMCLRSQLLFLRRH